MWLHSASVASPRRCWRAGNFNPISQRLCGQPLVWGTWHQLLFQETFTLRKSSDKHHRQSVRKAHETGRQREKKRKWASDLSSQNHDGAPVQSGPTPPFLVTEKQVSCWLLGWANKSSLPWWTPLCTSDGKHCASETLQHKVLLSTCSQALEQLGAVYLYVCLFIPHWNINRARTGTLSVLPLLLPHHLAHGSQAGMVLAL